MTRNLMFWGVALLRRGSLSDGGPSFVPLCGTSEGDLCDSQRSEREGFEPSVPFRVHMISNHAHSTTLSPLLVSGPFGRTVKSAYQGGDIKDFRDGGRAAGTAPDPIGGLPPPAKLPDNQRISARIAV